MNAENSETKEPAYAVLQWAKCSYFYSYCYSTAFAIAAIYVAYRYNVRSIQFSRMLGRDLIHDADQAGLRAISPHNARGVPIPQPGYLTDCPLSG